MLNDIGVRLAGVRTIQAGVVDGLDGGSGCSIGGLLALFVGHDGLSTVQGGILVM